MLEKELKPGGNPQVGTRGLREREGNLQVGGLQAEEMHKAFQAAWVPRCPRGLILRDEEVQAVLTGIGRQSDLFTIDRKHKGSFRQTLGFLKAVLMFHWGGCLPIICGRTAVTLYTVQCISKSRGLKICSESHHPFYIYCYCPLTGVSASASELVILWISLLLYSIQQPERVIESITQVITFLFKTAECTSHSHSAKTPGLSRAHCHPTPNLPPKSHLCPLPPTLLPHLTFDWSHLLSCTLPGQSASASLVSLLFPDQPRGTWVYCRTFALTVLSDSQFFLPCICVDYFPIAPPSGLCLNVTPRPS